MRPAIVSPKTDPHVKAAAIGFVKVNMIAFLNLINCVIAPPIAHDKGGIAAVTPTKEETKIFVPSLALPNEVTILVAPSITDLRAGARDFPTS